LERKVLQGCGRVVEMPQEAPLEKVLKRAVKEKVSFVYVREWPNYVTNALNWIASNEGWHFRFKARFLEAEKIKVFLQEKVRCQTPDTL